MDTVTTTQGTIRPSRFQIVLTDLVIPASKIPTRRRSTLRLRDPQRDQVQAPAPRIVFGCLPTTHVIAGPPISGTRWDTSVLDAAG
jgi:hypothetical protein